MDPTAIKDVLWKQLGASIDMLQDAISACPDELWERPSAGMGFWYMAYHALWFLDHDLSPAEGEFTPPGFDIYNYEAGDARPPFEHPYSRSDVTEYVRHCRRRCKDAIGGIDERDSGHLRGCHRINANAIELIIYQIRHVQHHAAQLNLLLRQTTDSAPDWVRRTKESRGLSLV